MEDDVFSKACPACWHTFLSLAQSITAAPIHSLGYLKLARLYFVIVFFFLNLFYLLLYVYVLMLKSEGTGGISLHHVVPGNGALVIRLGSSPLHTEPWF